MRVWRQSCQISSFLPSLPASPLTFPSLVFFFLQPPLRRSYCVAIALAFSERCMANAMLCLPFFISLLIFLPPLSPSPSLAQVSITLTCTRMHRHLLSFLLCSLSFFLCELSLKGTQSFFPSFFLTQVLGYSEGVQVQDYVSGSWEASIVFLCLPCDCLQCLPAITGLMV